MASKELFDTFDVARLVKSAPRTVEHWAQRGQISGTMRVGREYRFDALSVEAQIDTGRFPQPLLISG